MGHILPLHIDKHSGWLLTYGWHYHTACNAGSAWLTVTWHWLIQPFLICPQVRWLIWLWTCLTFSDFWRRFLFMSSFPLTITTDQGQKCEQTETGDNSVLCVCSRVACRMCKIMCGETVCDPMCGGGSIPIEVSFMSFVLVTLMSVLC